MNWISVVLGIVVLIIIIVLIFLVVRMFTSNNKKILDKFSSALTGDTSNGLIALYFVSPSAESGNYLLFNSRTDTSYSGTFTVDRTNNRDFTGTYTLDAPQYLSTNNQEKEKVINLTGDIANLDVRYQNDRYTAIPSNVLNDLFGIRDGERIILSQSSAAE